MPYPGTAYWPYGCFISFPGLICLFIITLNITGITFPFLSVIFIVLLLLLADGGRKCFILVHLIFGPIGVSFPLPFLFFCGEDIAMEELFLVDSLSIAMFSSQEVYFCFVSFRSFLHRFCW